MSRLFVNRLTVVDCSYLHPWRGLLGASWLVDLELGGRLDAQGMVLDFGDVKKTVKRLIDEGFDHKLLVPAGHPGLTLEADGDGLRLRFELAGGGIIEHSSPRDAVTLVPGRGVTPATLQPAIVAALRPELPDNVDDIGLRLWPEAIDGAHYRYSHGLKHHCGNCQRIAHGHRSRLEISLDGVRRADVEAAWAERLRDIYIATREDETGCENSGHRCFRYDSAQGGFRLVLPADRVYLVDNDSTVENIAQHIAERVAAEFPGSKVRVAAYEGVDKGAIGLA